MTDSIHFDVAASEPVAHWSLRRHCSISPRGLMLNVAALTSILCIVGLGFWLAGYAVIFFFCAGEALALSAAVLFHAAHAIDGEQIVLTGQTIEVKATCGLRSRTFRLNSAWTRLESSANEEPPTLCCGATRVPVAVFLADTARRQFSVDFNSTMARWRAGPSPRLDPAAARVVR